MVGIRNIEPSDFGGVPMEKLRGWAREGSPSSMFAHSSRWRAENDYLAALAEEIKAKLAEAGAVLQSRSGEEMHNALSPVVLWTEATAETAKAHSVRMMEQGEAFLRLSRAVPGEDEDDQVPRTQWLRDDWSGFGGGAADVEPAQVHNEKQRQQAVTAYETYDKTSRQHVAASPLFTPPPGSEDEKKRRGDDEPPAETGSAWAGGGGAGVAGGGVTPGGGGGTDRPPPPGGFSGIGSGGPTAGGGTGSGQQAAPRGPGGMAGAGMAGRPAARDSDDELDHETPDYLVADRGIFDDDIPKTAPPVFE